MRRDRLLTRLVRERFVITLKTGETFDGLLNEWDQRTVSFVDAHAVTQRETVPVDGELFVPMEQVAYMQRPVR